MATKKRGGLSQFTVPKSDAKPDPAPAAEPTEAETQKPRKKTETAKKPDIVRTTVGMNRDALKALKYLATDEDVSVNALLVEGVNLVFRSRGKPEIG
ncbi:MAG TPA: hypothetical protein DCP75_09055 [Haliea salexigens]|uniref:Antitoxin-like ribbon-helix-helix domain-containing protein n=1 Tax=Haliea salexigens TaxID=287487 RepID=A0A3C1KM67_9GAMM|nr:hypothetical protein [Haliea salexigens]|tara:strand:+ start:3735 stop:4025 length:291 start_codon:yes stop_codon:yes gene_type:complete